MRIFRNFCGFFDVCRIEIKQNELEITMQPLSEKLINVNRQLTVLQERGKQMDLVFQNSQFIQSVYTSTSESKII